MSTCRMLRTLIDPKDVGKPIRNVLLADGGVVVLAVIGARLFFVDELKYNVHPSRLGILVDFLRLGDTQHVVELLESYSRTGSPAHLLAASQALFDSEQWDDPRSAEPWANVAAALLDAYRGGRLAASRVSRIRSMASLHHVPLPLAVFLHRVARRIDRREEELHRVTALLADLVAELEAVHLAHRPDHDARFVAAAPRRAPRRDDAARIVVARLLFVGVPDDVPGDPVRLRVRVLLPDVAADSSQLTFLMTDSPSTSWNPRSS